MPSILMLTVRFFVKGGGGEGLGQLSREGGPIKNVNLQMGGGGGLTVLERGVVRVSVVKQKFSSLSCLQLGGYFH